MKLLCATPDCPNYVSRVPQPKKGAEQPRGPWYCADCMKRCSCLKPEQVLGCGTRAQAAALLEGSRERCEVHGG